MVAPTRGMSLPIRCFLLCTAIVPAAASPVIANDVADACHEFERAEVIFVGRVKSAPITRRISRDVSLTPLIVETAFRGVTTPELFLWNQGQPDLDPARSYLFYA